MHVGRTTLLHDPTQAFDAGLMAQIVAFDLGQTPRLDGGDGLVELRAQAPAQVGLQQRARRIQVVRHPVERGVQRHIGIVCMQLQCQRHRGRFV